MSAGVPWKFSPSSR